MKFKLGSRVICKGIMDGRHIEGQFGTIAHIYEQNPPRFCIVTFDKNFDSGGKQWDVFYEQLVMAGRFNEGDIIEIDGE